MATGVLVVGIERATRLLGHLLVTDKAYDATIRLGAATTTDDVEGEVLTTASTAAITDDAVRAALALQVGEVDQRPSAVSAIKVDGRRAYERVRAGEDVELPARRVRIDEIAVHSITTGPEFVDVEVSVRCSSGTYIRAIARDLGTALGVGGHLTALRRTAVGQFDLAMAHTLDELADDFTVLPIAEAARRSFLSIDLDETQAAFVRVGRKLPLDLPEGVPVALFEPEGTFLALYERGGQLARPVAVFV